MRLNKYIRKRVKEIKEIRAVIDVKSCRHVHDLIFITLNENNYIVNDQIIDLYGDIMKKFKKKLFDFTICDWSRSVIEGYTNVVYKAWEDKK